MEAYLDNSATTVVAEEVKDIMIKAMCEDYGNPSSLHLKGVEAEKYIRTAKEIISKNLKVEEKEIIFTSGGTESNNLAIIGSATANKRAGNHIITSCFEHPSVLSTMEFLKEQGYRITYLPVDKDGIVDMEALKNELCEDTILVSIMYVNNEIGAVEPVNEISKIVKEYNPNIIFHVDAIQSFGKYVINPKKAGIDLLSVSGHKINGPKGSGFLYASGKIKLNPIIYGGGQQKGMRSGTENVPAIAGLGEAVKLCYKDFNEKIEKLISIKDYFIDEISVIENIKINSKKGMEGAPHIVSVSFIGVRSEVMLHTLEERDIYVSAGSACSSNKQKNVSATLKGIGLKPEEIDSTIRFSFSCDTTKEEIDYTIDVIKENISVLRKFIRK
ncbi:MAG: cysteine desulfurase [Lachnospiraceae bacterium]|nr:cysteine desulfurase [Lachnospiraceae bacterium]